MCPMCEKRAQLLLQQQTVVESTVGSAPTSKVSDSQNGKSHLFRNPFRACKSLTHQCCSPLCESQRTSMASGRRSSVVRPSSTPEHSGHLTYPQEDYRVSESPLSADSVPSKFQQLELEPQGPVERKRKRRGLLTRLKLLTHGVPPYELDHQKVERESSGNESSFTACGRKVMAVADELEHGERVREGALLPSVATLLAAETDLDTMSEVSMSLSETDVSETTMLSMMNLNGSFSSPHEFSYRGSTLKSSTYDDDASSFAIIPRTSMNSSFAHDGASDASGLSDRFGELDIGYLSLEESGEGPEFDDTVSISSSQHENLDLDMHPQDDTVSESDLDQDYSISTDSQEWITETEDASSILQRSRSHNSKYNLRQDLETTPPLLQPSDANKDSPGSVKKDPLSMKKNPLFVKKDHLNEGRKKSDDAKEKTQPAVKKGSPPPDVPNTTLIEYLCSNCRRKEKKAYQQGQQEPQPTTKNVTKKENPMSTYFQTYMAGKDQAVIAAKVVVLLGKYGNRKGLRVAKLSPGSKDFENEVRLSANELDRLRTMINPNSDAVTAFQNEVARMMLEGVDVPDLNVDVEQFIAGYMKLNSPFYIDLIEDFFKSVCIDCFGHIDNAQRVKSLPAHQRPAYTVLKPRKTKNPTKTLTGKQ